MYSSAFTFSFPVESLFGPTFLLFIWHCSLFIFYLYSAVRYTPHVWAWYIYSEAQPAPGLGAIFQILVTLWLIQCVQQRRWCFWAGLSTAAVWLPRFWSCHTLLLSHQDPGWCWLKDRESQGGTPGCCAQQTCPAFSSRLFFLLGFNCVFRSHLTSATSCLIFHCSGPYSDKLFKLWAFQAFPIKCK